MTVSSVVPVNNYTGNNFTTTFDFDFYIESESELSVTLISQDGSETELVLNEDYSINEIGSTTGSYITFPLNSSSHSVLSDTEKISLALVLEIEQETEFPACERLDLPTLEKTFDYLTRLIQILNRKTDRAVKVHEGSNFDTDELVKDVEVISNNMDALNNIEQSMPTINSVASDLTNIDVVGTDIFNVNSVASDLTNIDAVSADISNIDTVTSKLTDISTVATNISDITAAGGHAQTALEKANESKIWAEGTDIEVQALGGEHSSKIWNAFLSLGKGKYLLEAFWSDHQINDQSCLRADTFSWHNGTTYYLAYNHLITDINEKTLQSETVAGVTIQYYLADDGHKICPSSQESNVLSLYNTTGIAWYYILDTANTRFKLPRTKYGFVGLRDNVGKFVPESLPNIVGTVYGLRSKAGTDTTFTGAFVNSGTQEGVSGGSDGTTYNTGSWTLKFNANKSSSTYQNNAPVQQKSTQMYLYFYVGQFSQTATEQTAGLNTELFNNKADRNLSNIESSCKVIDGQWINKHLLFGTAVALGTYTVDLSDYLPEDNCNYEIIINCSCAPSSSATNAFIVFYSSVIEPSSKTNSYSQINANNVTGSVRNNFILPVGIDRKLYYLIDGVAFSAMYLRIYGYRRLGTNN